MKQIEMQKRINELYEMAVSRYICESNFDVYDWLMVKEKEEYEDLMVKTGQQERSG